VKGKDGSPRRRRRRGEDLGDGAEVARLGQTSQAWEAGRGFIGPEDIRYRQGVGWLGPKISDTGKEWVGWARRYPILSRSVFDGPTIRE
jgi:hypothetical protein